MGTEASITLTFPRAGIDRSKGFGKQLPKPSVGGEYARTTYLAQNVRTFTPGENRARGGTRPGLSRFVVGTVAGTTFVVQDLRLLVGSGYAPPGSGTVQPSQSGRVVTLVSVCQGNVFVLNPGDTAFAATINGTMEVPPLNFSGLMYSTQCNQKLFFADGTNYVYYDPTDNTVRQWLATAGTLPVDSLNNKPRLICTWRGRIVLSGLLKDPQNWFMSAVANPFNFDYAPLSPTPTQAVAGNNESLGLIGDVVTALIPYSDDVLIFGGDHTIFMMRGDPMAGGQIDRVSDVVGMAWGTPWCKDPYGTVYFFGNRCSVYTLIPGQQPQRISQPIENMLGPINTGTNALHMQWDDVAQGVWLFVTPLVAPAATTHFFYDWRAGAWFTVKFRNENMNPLCSCVFDGNLAADRKVLVGGWDGYVRYFDSSATQDDGEDIEWEVWLGPFLTNLGDETMVKELQAILGATSADANYAVYVARTAEEALASVPVVTGTWTAGRNLNSYVRRAGFAAYVKLSGTGSFQMESVRAVLATQGKIRQRSR